MKTGVPDRGLRGDKGSTLGDGRVWNEIEGDNSRPMGSDGD